MNQIKTLTGKNALVTGGSRGVGKSIVARLAREGANIIFNNSSQNQAAVDYAKEISEKYGVNCIYVKCDIQNENEIEDMVNLAKEKFGRIDILVNNAGRPCFGATETLSLEALNECMKINYIAPFLFCQKIVPMMKENKWGRIINYTSGTTQQGQVQPNLGGYIAAKNAVNSLTKVLAKEVGDFGITVNCIIPGCIDTDMFNGGVTAYSASLGIPAEAVKTNILSSQIIKEAINPETLAEFTYYLCTDHARGLTGGLFPVDHGFSC